MIAKARARSTRVALAAAIFGVLAGCGGGGNKTYSRSAFTACLRHDGVTAAGLNELGATAFQREALGQDAGTADFLAARFRNGEFISFIFAKDAAGAKRVVARIQRQVKSGLVGAGKYVVTGNMVVLLGLHPTVGVEKTISSCGTDALVK